MRVKRLGWRSTNSSGLGWLTDGTRKVQTRFIWNICNVSDRPWVEPTLKKFVAFYRVFFTKQLAQFASVGPIRWWLCRQLNYFKGSSSYLRWLRCSYSSCWISNSLNCIIKRCLAICSSASYCFSSSSFLCFDISISRSRWLDFFEEVKCNSDFEWWDVYCSAAFCFRPNQGTLEQPLLSYFIVIISL